MEAPDPLAPAHNAKPVFAMEGEAGLIFGEDPGLEGPDAFLLGLRDQLAQQSIADAVATGVIPDIDTDFRDTRVNFTG